MMAVIIRIIKSLHLKETSSFDLIVKSMKQARIERYKQI